MAHEHDKEKEKEKEQPKVGEPTKEEKAEAGKETKERGKDSEHLKDHEVPATDKKATDAEKTSTVAGAAGAAVGLPQ